MQYFLGKQDMRTLQQAQEQSVLLTNGLGGYASVTAAFSVPRCDQGILIAAVKAPNERISMVHRLRERLCIGKNKFFLSSQPFARKAGCEEGFRYLTAFTLDPVPRWTYYLQGVTVKRTLCIGPGKNTSAVLYEIENLSGQDCVLRVDPFLKFAPKEMALKEKKEFFCSRGSVTDGRYTLYISSEGTIRKTCTSWQRLVYPEDAKDGRPGNGLCANCFCISIRVPAGEKVSKGIVFSMEPDVISAEQILREYEQHHRELETRCGFTAPVARQLAISADAFIAHRESTKGKTILAGYPLFSDWGRDTMIALPGCCLSTGRYEEAKSILRTFLVYEKDGLVPNLFPEGESKPMYNTVDAALLLIDCIWQYFRRTGDGTFVREAWSTMEHIIACYRRGTHHSIGMDADGLIFAGGGYDQVTWMDVCVNGILPTPRHGKPVEINAYWYNALRIMDMLAMELGLDRADYRTLSEQVKRSFCEKFYMEDKGYLKDVLSGTAADEQIRCNQIWALSMSFTMLDRTQERRVLDTVYRHLYTPCGLRTLSPEDPEYHGSYGGTQVERDMAYHQGTVWVFPLGAYYLAWLKVYGNTPEAAERVREQLRPLEAMLRQGCLGQLPEIYDGDHPTEGKGCFAQAWSVGEMLRVFEAIEKI
ncbi:MAG: glycogen debranching enzyme family protein [Oscillospiraceae bacterium]|nr:glycogen debranching enzyme family protein [Oscillospiraceae bacterium]